ncbi:hypothetical protein BS47DRAFT_1391885 [Hydnum rufescens UP504]|uniref:Uncharacterized protein n=1 Tax=Hydnum rufescens UP504 TaxID=1448309 RepID=A0A9P6DYQ0_9AGAM|nr:hypothetical protein BS47DRAFT_1391885 [Hydnum rufescens UP504]
MTDLEENNQPTGLHQDNPEPPSHDNDENSGEPRHDVNYVHPSLVSEDGLRQSDIAAAAIAPGIHPAYKRDQYSSIPLNPIPLSRLRDYFLNKSSHSAANLLHKRTVVHIDDKYRCDPHSDEVHLTNPIHRLDYRLTVANSIGLGAIIPNARANHNFSMNLDFRKPYSGLQRQSGTTRILSSGTACCSLEEGACEPGSVKGGTTRLLRAQYRMVISFFAFLLSKNRDKSFICTQPYGVSLTDAEPNFHNHFSLLDAQYAFIVMRIQDLKLLDQHMWLSTHAPITVTCKYGQDQQIGVEDEADTWQQERDYGRIRHMSFALASDISAQIAQGFEDIPAATIRGQHDVLYDSWDADLRVEIEDLEGLPLLDDSEKEIRIYNQEGNRVPRREPLFYGDEAPCGVLLNLATCEALFVLEPSMIDEGEEHVYVSVYPQAYLRHIGHMRANCVMRDFRAVIKRINNTITHPEGESDDSDDEIEAEYLSARPAALWGTSFQAYNEMVHRFTDRTEAWTSSKAR